MKILVLAARIDNNRQTGLDVGNDNVVNDAAFVISQYGIFLLAGF